MLQLSVYIVFKAGGQLISYCEVSMCTSAAKYRNYNQLMRCVAFESFKLETLGQCSPLVQVLTPHTFSHF